MAAALTEAHRMMLSAAALPGVAGSIRYRLQRAANRYRSMLERVATVLAADIGAEPGKPPAAS